MPAGRSRLSPACCPSQQAISTVPTLTERALAMEERALTVSKIPTSPIPSRLYTRLRGCQVGPVRGADSPKGRRTKLICFESPDDFTALPAVVASSIAGVVPSTFAQAQAPPAIATQSSAQWASGAKDFPITYAGFDPHRITEPLLDVAMTEWVSLVSWDVSHTRFISDIR